MKPDTQANLAVPAVYKNDAASWSYIEDV
jgi:hypothetical protein